MTRLQKARIKSLNKIVKQQAKQIAKLEKVEQEFKLFKNVVFSSLKKMEREI